MENKMMRRGLAIALSMAMLLTGVPFSGMSVKAAENETTQEDSSDETQKEAKRTELKQLIDDCKALNLSGYKRAGRALLKLQLASAGEVYADTTKSLTELEEAVTKLQKAKDALIDVNTADGTVNVKKVEGIGSDFIRGVDISTYASLMDSGVVFKDWDGNTIATGTPFFKLLKDSGVNYVRLRIWNDPYDADGNGYGAGNCDVEKAVKMGKWATDAGMKVLLDFHYSDFWADPGRQVAPKAWANLTIDKKAEALETYTNESLNTILDAGVDVGMVQVGNETNGVLCGEKGNWTNICKLFAAGSKAIRSVSEERNKDILIAIHFANPEKAGTMKGFAKTLKDNNIDYDIFASSYYPFWHGTLANLTSVLSEISKTYDKKVIVAETSWAYTLEDGDGQDNGVREGAESQDRTAYDISAQGQADEVRDVIEAVKNVGDAGLGIFYWEPAWIPVNVYDAAAENAAEVLAANKQAWETYGSGWASSYSISYDPNVDETNYGGSEWDNQALFDFEGYPLPSLNVFKYVETGAAVPPSLESYKITYQLNGGTNHASNPAKYTLADEVVFKAPSRAGYTFEGWYADSSFTKAFPEIPEMTTGDLTLYAKWKVNAPSTYKITYKLNGGTNHKSNPASYSNKQVTLKNPVRKNYTFGGWYLDSKFKKKITTISPSSKKEITVYAKWNKVSVKKVSVRKAVNSSKKKIKVTIGKVSGAKGYRVQYSTDKKFKKNVKTTKPAAKTSVTLSGLKKGKTYYVRACAYKLDSGNNKIFGKYGAYKKVKIKK